MDQALGKYGVLALRLSLGTLFLAHGLLKLLVFTIPGTVAYFEKLGFPGFFAYLTIFAELGGGEALFQIFSEESNQYIPLFPVYLSSQNWVN